MNIDPALRRDSVYFLVGPALVSILIAALFHIHPWPVSMSAQAQNFDWLITGWWLKICSTKGYSPAIA